jgi:hypothetical protein
MAAGLASSRTFGLNTSNANTPLGAKWRLIMEKVARISRSNVSAATSCARRKLAQTGGPDRSCACRPASAQQKPLQRPARSLALFSIGGDRSSPTFGIPRWQPAPSTGLFHRPIPTRRRMLVGRVPRNRAGVHRPEVARRIVRGGRRDQNSTLANPCIVEIFLLCITSGHLDLQIDTSRAIGD